MTSFCFERERSGEIQGVTVRLNGLEAPDGCGERMGYSQCVGETADRGDRARRVGRR